VKLRYTARALFELDLILTHIARHSPQGARKVQRRIKTIIDLLTQHPELGRATRRHGIRRLVVLPYPYLVLYQVSEEEVIILGVRHAARKPSPMSGG
jgi:toxin ParE1/3/4